MQTVESEDGTAIAYEVVGEGPAVVLVDGAMCFRDAGPMRPIAELLAPHFAVYLYDRRGRGASSDNTAPDAAPSDFYEREIDDIAALIARAGGSVAALGISSGGGLLLRAADRLGPDRLSRIAVYEPPFLPEAMRPAAAEYTVELRSALAAGRREDALALFLRRVGVPEEGMQGMKRSPTWPATVSLAPTLAYDDAAMGDGSVPRALVERLTVPVLVLAGGASPEFLQYGARTIATTAADGHFDLLADQTHDIQASAIAPALTAFFEQ